MILYKCDLCGEVRDCVPRQIEQKEYDLCPDCWSDLALKLNGKGRPKPDRRASRTLPPAMIPELSPEKKERFPGQPPEIIGEWAGGESGRTN